MWKTYFSSFLHDFAGWHLALENVRGKLGMLRCQKERLDIIANKECPLLFDVCVFTKAIGHMHGAAKCVSVT